MSSISPRIVSRVRASRSTDEAFRAQRRRHVAVVVVVAQHREHAVRRRQRRKRLGGRPDEPAIPPGDVVAAEDHQVGRFGHDQAHRAIDHLVRNRLAAMQIGQESDAQSGERVRQARDGQRLARQLDVIALVEVPVRDAPVTAPIPAAASPSAGRAG